MTEFDKNTARSMLVNLVQRLDHYDISTFRVRMNAIMEAADLRDPEDRTDFTFMQRRETD